MLTDIFLMVTIAITGSTGTFFLISVIIGILKDTFTKELKNKAAIPEALASLTVAIILFLLSALIASWI